MVCHYRELAHSKVEFPLQDFMSFKELYTISHVTHLLFFFSQEQVKPLELSKM